MSQPESIIHLANVSKHYGELAAVHDVSLRIEPGEIVGFVGPNGAGKTTTLSMLMGAIRPSQGQITLFGSQVVRPQSAHLTHDRIGYIAGDMALPDNLTGNQYLNFMGRRLRADPDMRSGLIAKLKPQLDMRINQLSRGNKQKIALIAALQHKPQLIIMDEPTSGLDPLMQDIFLDMVTRQAKRGATVLMSSHILSEVADVCDRILFMKQGRIVSDRPIDQITLEAGKLVTIDAQSEVIADLKRSLPTGCRQVTEQSGRLRFSYDGPLRPLLRWLSVRDIDDLSIADRELDDIFHEMYRETKR